MRKTPLSFSLFNRFFHLLSCGRARSPATRNSYANTRGHRAFEKVTAVTHKGIPNKRAGQLTMPQSREERPNERLRSGARSRRGDSAALHTRFYLHLARTPALYPSTAPSRLSGRISDDDIRIGRTSPTLTRDSCSQESCSSPTR